MAALLPVGDRSVWAQVGTENWVETGVREGRDSGRWRGAENNMVAKQVKTGI